MWLVFLWRVVCSTYYFHCGFYPSGASTLFVTLFHSQFLDVMCHSSEGISQCLSNLTSGWELLVPALCCCCGPSSSLWCSCCAVSLPGCRCERAPAAPAPAARCLTGSVCALVCCGCLLGSWGPAGRKWCAAGGSASSGSRCLHPNRSCLYEAPFVRCWTWPAESDGCTPAETNELHIPLWWTDTAAASSWRVFRRCIFGREAGRWRCRLRCLWLIHSQQKSSSEPLSRTWGSWPCVWVDHGRGRHRRRRCHEGSCAETTKPLPAASACLDVLLHRWSNSLNPASAWQRPQLLPGL